MPVMPPMHGPRAAFRDLRAFMGQRSREQVLGMSLAVLSTVIIVILFLVDSKINTSPGAAIIYVEDYPSNRTDADIIAQQKKDQAELERRKAESRRQFQEIQNQLGIE